MTAEPPIDEYQSSRFGSCNEFTIGMSPTPRHTQPQSFPAQSQQSFWAEERRKSANSSNDVVNNEFGKDRKGTNHERKTSLE